MQTGLSMLCFVLSICYFCQAPLKAFLIYNLIKSLGQCHEIYESVSILQMRKLRH